MVIGFKPQFMFKILNGTKIHTIRTDEPDRWQSGRIMHMATGTRTRYYNCFHQATCTGFQYVLIDCYHEAIGILENGIVSKWLDSEVVEKLIKNDGFDSAEQFWWWFRETPPDKNLKLIHWTDLRY